MTTDPDEPVLQVHAANAEWESVCPKCNAMPGIECTSIVSGCCIDGMHAERFRGYLNFPDAPAACDDDASNADGFRLSLKDLKIDDLPIAVYIARQRIVYSRSGFCIGFAAATLIAGVYFWFAS